MPVFALEFDTSVDDDIRRNYNPNKIEDDLQLPALPKVLTEKAKPAQDLQIKPVSNVAQAKVKSQQQVADELTPISKIQSKKTVLSNVKQDNYAVLKEGTKIRVKLSSSISDKTHRGTRVAFVSQYPVSTTYFTIPMGTVFYGKIIESHRPQLSANGGLIAIQVDSMSINGQKHDVNAVIAEVNFKKVFFNKIKGKRKYLSSMFHSMKPGFRFFNSMRMAAGNLAQDSSTVILVPFSLLLGAFSVAGNICASPIVALFYKGDSIYIREGSEFVLKLVQDTYIYN